MSALLQISPHNRGYHTNKTKKLEGFNKPNAYSSATHLWHKLSKKKKRSKLQPLQLQPDLLYQPAPLYQLENMVK
jgi:hypothetical protein